jgi:putative SOS response-associated peptidase YedK
MCGRFTLARSPKDVARAFDLDEVPNSRLGTILPLRSLWGWLCDENAAKKSLTDCISSQFERI